MLGTIHVWFRSKDDADWFFERLFTLGFRVSMVSETPIVVWAIDGE